MTRVSLCMIVRNEERLLPECLESVRGIVDEIVIVDTGSRDCTMAIARAHGAILAHHSWNNNFADARNVALANSSGDWILLLDADERLAPGAGDVILEAIRQDNLDCGLLPLHNALRFDASQAEILSGKYRKNEPFALPRLFRRTEDLRWRGAIHEGVVEWITHSGRRIGFIPAPIIHLGSVPELRQARGKWARNVELLQQRLAQEPDYVAGYTYLAAEHLNQGEIPQSRLVLEQGWAALLRVSLGTGPLPAIVTLASLRAQLQLVEGQYDQALATLETASRMTRWHPNLSWIEARVLVTRAIFERKPDIKDLERALGLLQRCLEARSEAYLEEPFPGVFDYASHKEMGQACLMLERPEQALTHFNAVLALQPEDPTSRYGRAEALLQMGRPRDALTEVEPLLKDGSSDGWLIAAMATYCLGFNQDISLFLRQARDRRARGLVLPRRLFWIEDLSGSANT